MGWHESERETKQPILLDLLLRFPQPPKACITDQLADTYCYAALTEKINNYLQGRHFRLLEHVGQQIYQLLKATLGENNSLSIRVFKKPPLPNVTQGVSFSYGDEPQPWSF